MESRAAGRRLKWILPVGSAILLAMAGCKFGSPSKSDEGASGEKTAASAQANGGPGIDLNCVAEWMQNPPGSFHYSYKKTGENFAEESADVTPQIIDGTFKNRSASNSVHGVRSDESSWRLAWGSLMGVAGMAGTVALVNHGSAMVQDGTEKLNGYDTIRYSIDTTRADAAEEGLFKSTLGDGGFEKGTAWVTDKGCPIKISLDTESRRRNGSVDKVAYAEEIVKKQN